MHTDVDKMLKQVREKTRYDVTVSRDDTVSTYAALTTASAAVASMSAGDANRLHARATNPPSILTEPHAKRLRKVATDIETRLDALKIDWLVEKFKELPVPLHKTFLQIVAGGNDG